MIQVKKSIKLQLSKNLVKKIKQGHSWVYRQALRNTPNVEPGTQAILLDNRGGREVARGFYSPNSPIALRICTTNMGEEINSNWAIRNMTHALNGREAFIDSNTSGYRLFNGEGDQLPGLVCDVYGEHAVIKLDGEAAEGFWDVGAIAGWIVENLKIKTVIQKFRNPEKEKTKVLIGVEPKSPISFKENGVQFTADILKGQKTGFFLDQRDNRLRIQRISKNKSVLNVFGYTGGFSVFAGLGNAKHVITLDLAKPALELANQHWELNGLDSSKHKIIAADAFEFLDENMKKGNKWVLVILDPPSFAPSEESLPKAILAYTKLISLGAQVTEKNGLLAAASCSSHIGQEQFLEICAESISKARRKATVIGVHGQPMDHPSPLIMPELRYLKFILMKLN